MDDPYDGIVGRTKLDRSRIEVLARRRDVAMKTRSLSD